MNAYTGRERCEYPPMTACEEAVEALLRRDPPPVLRAADAESLRLLLGISGGDEQAA
jgi:hypothetical protein